MRISWRSPTNNKKTATLTDCFSNVYPTQELDNLEDGAKIFKLVGPVLIPQEADEARNTVNTRIEYISKEVASSKARAQKVEKEQQERRIALLTEQQKFQALVQQVSAPKQ